MPWTGGVYSLPTNVSNYASAGGLVVASVFASAHDDLAAGINTCITKDGTNTPTANLPMGGNKHTNVKSAASRTDYLMTEQAITQWPVYLVDQNTGAQSTSISCSPPIGAWPTNNAEGHTAKVKMIASYPSLTTGNTPTTFLHIATTGEAILTPSGNNLWPNALKSGHIYDFVHDGTQWRVQNPTPATHIFAVDGLALNAGDTTMTLSTSFSTTANIYIAENLAVIAVDTTTTFMLDPGTSTAYLALSAVPAFARPVSARNGGAQLMDNGGSTQNFDIQVKATGLIEFRGTADAFKLDGQYKIPPFTFAYTLASAF